MSAISYITVIKYPIKATYEREDLSQLMLGGYSPS